MALLRGAVDYFMQGAALAVIVAVPIWALIELRARSLFVTRQEWHESRANEAEKYASLVVAPLQDVTERLTEIAVEQATLAEAHRGVKRSLDDLRDEIRQMRNGA